MFFDLSNYWIFLAFMSVLYVLLNNFLQNNIGGKGRFRALQAEMRETNKKMMDAAKGKRDKEYDELTKQYMKQTMDLTQLQMKMAFAILIPFFILITLVFPLFEPGAQDDAHMQLFDDGLAAHCDRAAGDGIYSGCFPLPANGTRGAWVISSSLLSASNETLARGETAIYYEGGKPEDVWLPPYQAGLLDSLLGKKAYSLNVSAGKRDYSAGETVRISSFAQLPLFTSAISPGSDQKTIDDAKQKFAENSAVLANGGTIGAFLLDKNRTAALFFGEGGARYLVEKDYGAGQIRVSETGTRVPGARIEASANMGTFFHVDLPFTLPLLNIRRIIGSNGVFIFYAFVLGIAYSIGRALYSKVSAKK